MREFDEGQDDPTQDVPVDIPVDGEPSSAPQVHTSARNVAAVATVALERGLLVRRNRQDARDNRLARNGAEVATAVVDGGERARRGRRDAQVITSTRSGQEVATATVHRREREHSSVGQDDIIRRVMGFRFPSPPRNVIIIRDSDDE